MSTYISDPTIVPRVQEYLLTNAHQIYIDLNLLADRLQNKYSEYSKRKRSAFRASVNKAYSIVLQHHGVDTAQEYYEDEAVVSSLNSDKMLNNLMNDQLKDLYSSVVKGVEGNELIDISSDESEHAPSRPDKNTNTNGMSPFYPEKR
ncbi:hypothetical protein NQ318_000144 [Aromia moschata]|uniref:NVL2 nucleolin binding domain-containing protein n=1 Tax=Aromia moschata TaxID=1265417 RepID=A0AAV8XK36_9CUCU|nr:hypothetical protein NQ318_000144 [Aromia moschata]